MNVLLDTSVVVAHLRRRLNLFRVAASAGVQVLFLSLTALGELYKGAERSDQPRSQYRLIENLLAEGLELINPNVSTAHHYAKASAELERQGQPIPENDLWVAATALASNLPLATRATPTSGGCPG